MPVVKPPLNSWFSGGWHAASLIGQRPAEPHVIRPSPAAGAAAGDGEDAGAAERLALAAGYGSDVAAPAPQVYDRPTAGHAGDDSPDLPAMCNLYSNTSARQAMIDLTKAMAVDASIGNAEPMREVWPDYAAPIARNTSDGRELALARWGLPSPAFALKGKKTDRGVTNVRNTASPHWRRWLRPEHRCLVPFTAFAEPERGPDGTSRNAWFALGDDRPLACFAGISVRGWTSVRKLKEGEVTADLFAFLTTEANAEVGAVHPKAMPVILTEEWERELWMTGAWPEAGQLQRPLEDGRLVRVR